MNIGVFFGSRSPEHDVSIITGQLIIKGLKDLGYKVIPVYISKSGKWFAGDEFGNLEFFKQPNYETKLNSYNFSLNLSSKKNKLEISRNSLFKSEKYEIDLAFPAFHGQNGEDGTIQGLFELLNVPYVGCSVASSAITVDKVLTKLMYEKFNIPTPKFKYFTKNDWINNNLEIVKDIESQLKYPLFIKPAKLGSSIGITKVKENKDLVFAIEVALHYDNKIIVEEGVENLKDLTIAVIGNEKLTLSKIQESGFSEDLFSYEDKYINDGGAQLGNAQKKIIIPANIEANIINQIEELAKKAYFALECSGTARIDFLYNEKTKEVFANEVNTMPGTLYHHLWRESGIPFSDLLSKLIDFAQEKFDAKQKMNFNFDSNILKQNNSKKLQNKLSN